MSIKMRLLALITFLILFSALLVSFTNYVIIKRDAKEKAQDHLIDESRETLDKIERIVRSQILLVQLWGKLGIFTSSLKYDIYDEANDYCRNLVQENKELYYIYLIGNDLSVKASSNRESVGQLYKESILKEHLAGKTWYFSDAVIDPVSGKQSYSIYSQIREEGRAGSEDAVGYIIAEFNWSNLMEIISWEETVGTGPLNSVEYMLMNKSGLLIGASEKELSDRLFNTDLVAEGLISAGQAGGRMEGSVIEDNLNGEEVFSGYAASSGYGEWEGAGWRMITMEKTSSALSALKVIRNRVIIIVGTLAAASLLFSLVLVNKYIGKPITSLIRGFEEIAGGNLNAEFELTNRDELGKLSSAGSVMIGNIRSLIIKISETSRQVSEVSNEILEISDRLSKVSDMQHSASEETMSTMTEMATSIQSVAEHAAGLENKVGETVHAMEQLGFLINEVATSTQDLSAAVEQTGSSTEEIVASIREVSQTTDEQNKIVEQADAVINEIKKSIEGVVNHVEKANTISKSNDRDGKDGEKSLKIAGESMDKMTSAIRSTVEAIRSHTARSTQIGDITDLIDGVVAQTDLLALNASIIAAQAGEHGKGFMVVADEIRELANRSKSATGEVKNVVHSIVEEADETVRIAEAALIEVEKSVKLSRSAEDAITNMLSGIADLDDLLTKISDACRHQMNLSQQVDKVMSAVNNIAARVTQVSRKQDKASYQIWQAAENMKKITVEVSSAMEKQAMTSAQVIKKMENMNFMTRDVARSMEEQNQGGNSIVKAMENIRNTSEINHGIVVELMKSSEGLSHQRELIIGLVNKFKV